MTEVRRRSSRRRKSNRQKIRDEAKLKKIAWLAVISAIGIAIVYIFVRNYMFKIT
jgi:hypothetical protein